MWETQDKTNELKKEKNNKDIMKSKDYKAPHSITGGDYSSIDWNNIRACVKQEKSLDLGFMETTLRIAHIQNPEGHYYPNKNSLAVK